MPTYSVKDEIQQAVAVALDFDADWRGEDYVGYICTREGLDIDSQEVLSWVVEAQRLYALGLL